MKDGKKKIYKPKPISGFPEWLPQERRAEQAWFDHIRTVFESYGFCSIETPSVEELDAINAKGGDGESDADKEIYVLERLHKEEGGKEARLALHFDQTVPLARYTAQHFNELVFPFKRYQIQRVWRGERPQAGRFREFYQCDIDVINVDKLPLHFDAEMPAVIWEILSSLPGMDEKFQIRISNRKILMGFMEGRGLDRNHKYATDIIRAIDKLEKIGEEEVTKLLKKIPGGSGNHEILLKLAKIKTSNPDELVDMITKACQPFDIEHGGFPTLVKGMVELEFVLKQLSHLPEGAVVADLAIVRGLDYYTGTVYETMFLDDPGYGSICSGGRYDDLAGNYINKHLPGVGISIGFSRLFERIRKNGTLPVKGISPADVMVVLPNEELRPLMMETAQTLRANGNKVETFHSPTKIDKQIKYALKKGIPYIWFPDLSEVKNMETRTQISATPKDWKPDED